MFGREINCPIDLIVGKPPNASKEECRNKCVEWLKSTLLTAFEKSNLYLKQSAKRQKTDHDKHATFRGN